MKEGILTEKEPFWDHGMVILVFGSKSVLVAHKLYSPYNDPQQFANATVLSAVSTNTNHVVQFMVNMFPFLSTWAQSRYTTIDSKYQDDIYDWMFFQNSHDDAHWWYRDGSMWSTIMSLFIDSDLPVARQTWLIPETESKSAKNLNRFIEMIQTKLITEPYGILSHYCEFQDILYHPKSNSNIFLNSGADDDCVGWYMYTISIARSKSRHDWLVKEFYEQISFERYKGSFTKRIIL
jgi:hypothetical protein